ncbi:AraC family transcriptional regulator [Streptomyces sp. NBC_00083]|uniref:helix-turn-helix transcriptional regulator n=1 Tax=Streptomyces sp. NBC_00083 TaxID=2975647 RepID=UPI00225A40FC|nr:AraC family transcriptional regulator [Streptomyces sp. NBC_00083]MCX5387071.1 AraC family transcriptional regulator [Streptomyces sp. NBC_00083]
MLPEITFRSSGMPPAQRFERWRDLMSQTHAPMDMSSEHADDFWVNQRNILLDDVAVYPMECHPLTFRRTARLIKKSDPEAYHLSYVVRGSGAITLGKETVVHTAGHFHTSDTSRSFDLSTGSDPVEIVGVEIPKALLPLPRAAADRVIGRKMSASNGMGALLATFLGQLARDSRSYQPADGPRLRTVLADLVGALFSGALDDDRSLTPESHRRALTLRIKAFIRNNSDDPRLDVASIAAAHHISVSYLHRLFQYEGDGTTVAGYLHKHRLAQARRDLADPASSGVPVHVISARRGFAHPATFSRAFRDAYGTTPTALRRQSLGLPV